MDNVFHINLAFDGDSTFNTMLSDTGDDFVTDFGSTTMVSTSDHRDLSHKDAPNQHPISAITDLSDTLDTCADSELTNLEIYSILQH